LKKCWCISPKQNPAFVAAMEDVLEVYHRPYNGQKPVICMDEQPVQLLGEQREPVPMNEHHSKREDNEYVHKGTCSVFMFAEIELSAMSSQCLNRRIETLDTLKRELEAWQYDRNRNQKTVEWQFTTKDARIKLHGLYQSI
jgi:hypothetical protein